MQSVPLGQPIRLVLVTRKATDPIRAIDDQARRTRPRLIEFFSIFKVDETPIPLPIVSKL